jgi:hypothetical protein
MVELVALPVPPMIPPTTPSRLLPVTTASGRPIGLSLLFPEPGSIAQDDGSSPSFVRTMLSNATGVSGAAAGGSSGALGGSFGALKVFGFGGGFTGSGSAGSSGSGASSSGSAASGSSSTIAIATVSSGPSAPGPTGATGIRPRNAACVAIANTTHPVSSAQGATFSSGVDIGSAAALVSVRSPRDAR